MNRVLTGDARTLDRVARRLNRRFIGRGGIAVSVTDDAVVIALQTPTPPGGVGGGATQIAWAKIMSVGSNAVMAKFADADGNVDPQAEEFRVYVYATDAMGVTWSPTLADASPKLVVGQYVQIVQMPACGAQRPAGWWLVGPPLALTCVPLGDDDGGLAWLLANISALRALVQES